MDVFAHAIYLRKKGVYTGHYQGLKILNLGNR